MRLDAVVAVVSGGASGLGRATVERLVADGARVIILDLPTSSGAALAAQLGPQVRFAAGDVRDEHDVAAACDLAMETYGALRVAVSCAGVAPPGRLLGRNGPLALDAFQSVVAINLLGTFNLARAAADRIAAAPPLGEERGVLVHTASIAAFDGQIGQVAYAASKAGVAGLTLPLARELAALLIRCVSIAPGVFDTALLAALPEHARRSLAEHIPHPRRLGRPEEYAALVAHVIENPLLNGEVIRLDGALRMAPR
jgi:NAD(P)-dependent dehydrogenase (short-subunit alcohol dehydrogenase family)